MQIEINGRQLTINYSPGTPDKMYLSNGDPGEMGDPPELEIISGNYIAGGRRLTQREIDDLDDNAAFMDECVMIAEEELQNEADLDADARYELRVEAAEARWDEENGH